MRNEANAYAELLGALGRGEITLEEFVRRMHGDGMRDVLPLEANVLLELHGPGGELKEERRVHNVICTAGKERLLLYTGGSLLAAFTGVAIGIGTQTANAAVTALNSENARAAGTLSNPDADTFRNSRVFAAGVGTGAITEAGLLDQNTSGGHILAYQTFAAVNKAAGDSLTVTWDIT